MRLKDIVAEANKVLINDGQAPVDTVVLSNGTDTIEVQGDGGVVVS